MAKRRFLFILAVIAGSGSASAQDDLVAAGEEVFVRCYACHAIGPPTKFKKPGPHMNDLFGRRPGVFRTTRNIPRRLSRGVRTRFGMKRLERRSSATRKWWSRHQDAILRAHEGWGDRGRARLFSDVRSGWDGCEVGPPPLRTCGASSSGAWSCLSALRRSPTCTAILRNLTSAVTAARALAFQTQNGQQMLSGEQPGSG